MEPEILDKHLESASKMFDNGKSFAEIRKTLETEGLDKDEISYVIRLVDEFAIEEEKMRGKIHRLKYVMMFGAGLLLLGLYTAFHFYQNSSLGGTMAFLVYIPIFIALYILWKAWKEKSKVEKNPPVIEDTKMKFDRRVRRGK